MLLTISNLFPRPDEPDRGVFNLQFFRALHAALGARFPAAAPGGRMLNLCLVPCWQVWRWSAIRHWTAPAEAPFETRYVPVFYVPRIGRNLSRHTYGAALRPFRAEAARRRAVLGTWLYPDAVAAARLAAAAGRPAWIKVHGTDVGHLAAAGRRGAILAACRRAAGVMSVSAKLCERLRESGVEGKKLHCVQNGVDRGLFCVAPRPAPSPLEGEGGGGGVVRAAATPHPNPLPQGERGCGGEGDAEEKGSRARGEPGYAGERNVVLFVGHLARVKGPDRLIAAWKAVLEAEPDAELWIVGAGPLRRGLEARVRQTGMDGSVSFLGAKPHREIPELMRAARCLCLPSRSEGMPNVVLEALACGTPVVATDVGEVPALLAGGENGMLVSSKDADGSAGLGQALVAALRREWRREAIAGSVGELSWEAAGRRAVELMMG